MSAAQVGPLYVAECKSSSKRMARVYGQDFRSKSMTVLPKTQMDFSASQETRRGKPPVRSPLASSPAPPSFHSASSSCSNSPTIYSPITPDVDNISFPPLRIVKSSNLPAQKYPRAIPSLPSLRASAQVTSTGRRHTTVFNPPTNTGTSPPLPVPPLNTRSCNVTFDSQLQAERRKCRYDLDQELTFAHKNMLDQSRAGRQSGSCLPYMYTEGLDDDCLDSSLISLTPSSTYSSSLYASEQDFEFLKHSPARPDLGTHIECPMFSEAETCEVRDFLRKEMIANLQPDPCSTDSSVTSEEGSEGKRSQDFSWEACDGSSEGDKIKGDKIQGEGAHDLLEKLGLLDDDKRGGFRGSNQVVLPSSTSSPPRLVADGADDVSVTLTALRSSFHLDDSTESAGSGDRDIALREELRTRLQAERSMELNRKCDSTFSTIRRPASTNQPPSRNMSSPDKKLISSPITLQNPPVPAVWKPMPALHTPQSSGEFGEVRISMRHPVTVEERELSYQRSAALERLESSISRLQAHSPHQPQHQFQPRRSHSHSPSVPLNGISSLAPTQSSHTRGGGILKKPKTLDPPLAEQSRSNRQMPMARSQTVIHGPHGRSSHAADAGAYDRHYHGRSPSTPEGVLRSQPGPASLAPAFSLRQMRPIPVPTTRLDADPFRAIRKDSVDLVDGVPRADGLRSFMNMTPEPCTTSTSKHVYGHTRSRSSVAVSAVNQAEKARKLLVRASSSVASWGRGLARAGSRSKQTENQKVQVQRIQTMGRA